MKLSSLWRRIFYSDAIPILEHWTQNVTPAEIRSLFLDNLKEGNDIVMPAFKDPEPENFENIVAALDVGPDRQIRVASIIRYLTLAHASKADIIQSTASTIEALIVSHAHFPFSAPVVLTKDAFCCAILLLTNRCQEPFRQADGGASEGKRWDYIRARPNERRLAFLYSAFVKPPTGIPSHDDILDVVCRVRYPFRRSPGRAQRVPISTFSLMPERLEPVQDLQGPVTVPVVQLQSLHDIVTAFPPRGTKPAAVLGFAGRDSLSAEQFVQWATEVQLFESLDQLFGVFLEPAVPQT